MKILVIHGPNLNLLGIREPEIYGNVTLEELNSVLLEEARKNNISMQFFQSNHEGDIIDAIHSAIHNGIRGIIINPGAFTHYSYAIRDAIAAVDIPTVEVHLSNIKNREDFRKISVIKDVCIAQVGGKGIQSYTDALQLLIKRISDE